MSILRIWRGYVEWNSMNDKRAREPRSELTSVSLLSPLAFGAAFEKLANFLIDHVVDAEPAPGLSLPPGWFGLFGPKSAQNERNSVRMASLVSEGQHLYTTGVLS
jgi:hypothetical protein